ncbi:MAG: GntR family transcriptional regulator [Anaerovorax sp.]
MFQLDLKGRKSIYEQVVDNMKELIIAGVMKPEEKLPSVRDLSKELTVNPNTVQKAYRQLEHQGFVYSSPGLGTFVSENINSKPDEKAIKEIAMRVKSDLGELLFLGLSIEEIQQLVNGIIEERRVGK